MTKEIELNVWERLVAMGILPKEGNYVTLKMIRELNSKIGLSAEDIERCDIIIREDGRALEKWKDEEMLKDATFTFHTKEVELIKEALLKLDKENKMIQDMFSIYEKFVGDTDGQTTEK